MSAGWIILVVGILLLGGCATSSINSPSATSTPDNAGRTLTATAREPTALPSATPTSKRTPHHTALPKTQTSQTAAVTPTYITAQPTMVTLPSVTNPTEAKTTPAGKIKTVFIIMMENHNWSDIQNNPSAPYINQTLLPQASYALQYFNPPGNHPSEPNYIWLEAGQSFGINSDDDPQSNHQSSSDHLVTFLDKAGFSWKAYQEGITGKVCPLTDEGLYAVKHNPMVFFDDVTNNNDPNSAYCIAHERPYSELQPDLQINTQAQYNFITPNLCNDMHDSSGCQTKDKIKNGDKWLSEQIPMIMGSQAYRQGGVIFIIWDESENGDHPIGMIVLSPFAKGGGYSNSIHYTHSSTLRTVEEIFNLTPMLGDAVNATDLSDLFKQFP
jgi:phosphatidylinositol-3-phosphatase